VIMRFMHWSWQDYCDLPAFYLDVLIDLVKEEQQDAEHKRAMAEVRGRRR